MKARQLSAPAAAGASTSLAVCRCVLWQLIEPARILVNDATAGTLCSSSSCSMLLTGRVSHRGQATAPGNVSLALADVRAGRQCPAAMWRPAIHNHQMPHAAGKMLPARPELVLQSQSAILQACLLRLLFVPAFALAGSHSASPAVVSLLTLLLGLSNGYLTCVAMMGPSFMKLEVRTGLPESVGTSCVLV